jgi:2-octaprenylphenol hydroxylase
MPSFDVIVIGAGIVGAGFALGLERAGLTVAVVEPNPPQLPAGGAAWDSRIYTISPGNAAWLGELGVWARMPAERLTRVERMLVHGDASGRRLEFTAYDAGLRELAWTAENRELQVGLWRALEAAAHVTLYARARCRDVMWERDRALLALDDATELSGRLIVGADGADSWIRDRAGIDQSVHSYGQLGVVANFETERPHEHTAFQWFRNDGVLALLPMPGERVSMVWSAPEARAQALLEASPEALCDEVARASAGSVGGLQLLTPAAGFPLKRQHVHRLVEPRIALIGDAAHNVHPLAGQGVNLGLRDARALAEVLGSRGPQSDCGDYALLRRYERARKEDILALEVTTDGLEKLFSAPAVWMARVRNLGLTFVDAQPPLKTALTRRAVA